MQHVIDFFRGLWPPSGDEDPSAWRRSVFVIMTVLSILLFTHLAAVKGFLVPVGIAPTPHYAAFQELIETHERDVIEIRGHQRALLYAIYAPQIRSLVRERCEAEDAAKRENINKILDRVLDDYRSAAGQRFEPMQGCNDV